MIDLRGKIALVTGAGAGIGRAITEAFAAAGATIVAAEVIESRAGELRRALEKSAPQCMVSVTDVRDRKAVEALLAEVDGRFGGLDILVNNVGDFCGIVKPLEQHTDEDIETLYSINLRSVLLVTRAAIPLLRKRAPGGSIINLSSIEAFRGIPMTSVYSAFKHALTGLTRCLALELGPAGIRVNAIAPETTETAQVPVSQMIAPQYRDHIARWIPLGRFGKPEDAAGCALFLACELSAWVTGTTINLDGGALAAGGWYRDPTGRWTSIPVITGNGFNP
ncbi:MAG TPA: SDR family NAD(P)-dependent oxidoreductase [Steroidobacteraceae bacterium]|nr:SDR family NAD(P)-dependent oxidoreductase [Steroidobacteraceae bacterium]